MYKKFKPIIKHVLEEMKACIGIDAQDASPLPKALKLMLKAPTFFSQMLPYDTYDPETSLFINKKSSGFVLETTPLLGSSEEIENSLASIINDLLPSEVDLQFMLWASPKIGTLLDRFKARRNKNSLFTWLAEKRVAYLATGARESLSQHGTLLLRDIRTFISVSADHDQLTPERLLSLREDIESTLLSMNVGSIALDAKALITLIHDLLSPEHSVYPAQMKWQEKESLATQMTDSEWKLFLSPQELAIFTESDARVVTPLAIRDYPDYPTQWRTSENIGQLFNTTLQLPCEAWVSFSLRKMDHEKAKTKAQMATMNRESTAKSPLAKFKPSISKEFRDWQFIRERLNEGETLVKSYYQILLFTNREERKSAEQRVRHLYQANGWKLRKESYLALQSFLATLPMMMSEGMFHDLKHFGRLKTMTAFNAVNIAPLQGEWKGTKTPSLLLPGRRGQITAWHPFDNEGGNYNIAVTAAPGKGKSVLVQEMIVSTLGAGGQVVVIDQGHSQQKTCQLLGGQFIEFTPDALISLNPFGFITDLNESMPLLKPLLATMVRPITGASEEEMSYLEQAVKAVFDDFGNKANLAKVSKWLSSQKNDISKNLAHLLFSYTEGVSAKLFAGDCTIDFENPFIVWELLALKSKKELRRIILQLIIYLTSQKMFQGNRTQIKSCIIDEAWDLFDDDNLAAGKFIEAGYRTARKFRGNFISIAHSISDFHKNPMSKAAFDCSDFKIILGQTDEAINKLKQDKIMDIDAFTERLLKSLKLTRDYSECVIKGPEGMSVHRILLDPYSRILYSTKGEEFDAVNHAVKNGLSLTDAIQQVAKDFHYV